MAQPASQPPDEDERLALLHGLQLLDSLPEPAFDRITRLATRLLGVPMALVSLVDRDRQWFKSRVGLAATETPREQAFCAHAILQTGPFVVTDALEDARFADNPLVTGALGLRFYAGVPIRTAGGLALGTLCALDQRPRTLSADDLQTLQDLADMVSQEVQLRESLLATQHRLDASERRFRAVFELAPVGVALVAPDGGWIGTNAALSALLGYDRDALRRETLTGLTWVDDRAAEATLLEALRQRQAERYTLEKRYVHANGEPVWVRQSVSLKFNAAGQPEYFVAVLEDIGARKAAEARLDAAMRELEAELTAVLEHANDAYICMDESSIITAWNLQAAEVFGWTAAEAIGRPMYELIVPPDMRQAHRDGVHRYVVTRHSTMMDRRLELPAVRKDGTVILLELRIRALNVDGRHLFSAFMHDISERKREENRRLQEARVDPLTGLYNRRALEEMLPQAMARADRDDKPLALLFIDLDGFKAVNDNLGHDAGDAVLRDVAARLRAHVRQTDTLVRLAGDEFTVVLERLQGGLPAARQVAQKLVDRLAQPFELDLGVARISPTAHREAETAKAHRG